MLTTVAGVTFLATLVSAWRNMRQWDEYHRGHVTRGQMVNKVFATVVLAVTTLAFWLVRGIF